MYKRRLYIVAVLLVHIFFMAHPANAADPVYAVVQNDPPNPGFCTMTAGSSINGMSAQVINNGTIYFIDQLSVPGAGLVTSAVLSAGVTSGTYGWFYIVNNAYSVPANTPITGTTYYFTDATYKTAFRMSRIVVNCTTGAIIELYNGPVVKDSNGPQFFDPGDDRVDPRPGDRIAIYCDSTTRLRVIGVGADGNAAGEAVFTLPETITGNFDLSKPLVSFAKKGTNLGIISMNVKRSLDKVYFYVAWNGGILNANGQGDFRKWFDAPSETCPINFK